MVFFNPSMAIVLVFNRPNLADAFNTITVNALVELIGGVYFWDAVIVLFRFIYPSPTNPVCFCRITFK